MAPRMPESFEDFMKRLKRDLKQGRTEVRFGRHHFNHAVCLEDGMFRVRRLEATTEEIEEYKREHGMFMPEQLEAISKPRTLVFEAESLEVVGEKLKPSWPF